MLEIRNAKLSDLEKIAKLESLCFSPAEAADRESLKQRLEVYPNHFWLLWRDGELVSMVNGMVSNEMELLDAFYTDATLHDESGDWQMLFGVETDPKFRKRGYASILMKEAIKDCVNDSRKGIILNCKDQYISFYEKLGFTNRGVAKSVHGGEKWNIMELNLEDSI